ncbi:hypothetical protein M885DRAFT_542293 [Pelagophyceae sp. CCMP2097]|nr:hypothetical protein M885DRAFT_542293 [Pelagophyceae sp. CCMP2097]
MRRIARLAARPRSCAPRAAALSSMVHYSGPGNAPVRKEVAPAVSRLEQHRQLVAAVQGGDAEAQFKMAVLLVKRAEETQDYTSAAPVEMLRRASAQGHVRALVRLAELTTEGGRFGLVKNYVAAAKLWHCAAQLGSALAQATMGDLCYQGKGVRRDRMRSYAYCDQAADQGEPCGMFALAIFLGMGLDGAPKDVPRALDLLAKVKKHTGARATDRIKAEAGEYWRIFDMFINPPKPTDEQRREFSQPMIPTPDQEAAFREGETTPAHQATIRDFLAEAVPTMAPQVAADRAAQAEAQARRPNVDAHTQTVHDFMLPEGHPERVKAARILAEKEAKKPRIKEKKPILWSDKSMRKFDRK